MANKAKAAAKRAARADAAYFEGAGINFRPSWKQHLAWQALEDGTTEEVMVSKPTRRPYTLADLRLIRTHYRDCTAAELAQRLGRTVGSLRGFIQARPELHKRALLQAA